MKTTRSAAKATKNNVAMLASMLAQSDANIKGSQGSERLRLQAEIDGIRAQMKRLGA